MDELASLDQSARENALERFRAVACVYPRLVCGVIRTDL
jgi:hypothetical protein